MTIPSNDARALHNLLESLGEDTAAMQTRWSEILQAEWATLQFARRHAEVVALFNGTMTQVASLPDQSRQRFERYAWSWWTAIVVPQEAWQSGVALKTVVERAGLDQLGSAADLIEARMRGSLAAPDSTDLTALHAACQEWIDALVADTDLPDPLRINLLQDLRHATWVIENAELFGVARVAAASEAVVGNVVAASAVVSPTKQGEWIERGKKLVAALAAIGAVYTGGQLTLELGTGAAQFLGELVSTATPSQTNPVAPGEVGTEEGSQAG